MAFIISNGTVISYAEASDIRGTDQRIFECNEFRYADAPNEPTSLDEYLEDLAKKSTARINQKIRASVAWRSYLASQGGNYSSQNIPDFVPGKILSRKADFTDICCYYVLKEFLIPKIATFEENSAELIKIQYYEQKFNSVLQELLQMFEWYDYDSSGVVTDSEKNIRPQRYRRSRGRRPIVGVR
jgi:hypothetical protein